MPNSFGRVFVCALLLTGNTIGAGMLGLPVQAAMTGTIPAISGLTVMWILMLVSGLIISWRMTIEPHVEGLPSMFQRDLGTVGNGFASLGFLINYFGIVVAYLTASAPIIIKLLGIDVPEPVMVTAVFVLFTLIVLFGVEAVQKSNTVLMILLFVTFVILVVMVIGHVDGERFGYMDWGYFPATLPIFITVFTYQCTVPVLARMLNYNRSDINKSLYLGLIISYVMAVGWTLCIIGALPLTGGSDSLLDTYEKGLAITIPLSNVLGSETLMVIASVFALIAITTSYITVGAGLMNFMRDMTHSFIKRRNQYTDAVFAFALPFAVTLIYPGLFLKALDIAGGVGVGLVFGILPSIILLRYAGKKVALAAGAVIMLLIYVVTALLDLGHTAGMITIDPQLISG